MSLFLTNVIVRWKEFRARRRQRRDGVGHNVLLEFRRRGQR